MDVIFLAFANNESQPLPTLKEEAEALFNILSPRQLKQHFILNRESYATIDSVSSYIAQTRDKLRIFLYSGHAGRDKLMLEGQSANAEGIAHLLGQCSHLKLVFLNGCSTYEQVKGLFDAGVPAVMATSAPIDDTKATEFSKRFFQALNDQNSIKEAFELAKGDLMSRYRDVHVELRGILLEPGGDQPEEGQWGLYVNPGKEGALDWKLPFQTVLADKESFVPNAVLIDTLIDTLAPYREEVKKIVEDESLGATKSILDKREAILKAIPHPISEQLRKLLVDETDSGSGLTFFHKVGRERLGQIIVIYNTLLELLGYTILAQLWDLSRKEGFKINDEHQSVLREFFVTPSGKDRSGKRILNLIGIVRAVLSMNDTPCFVDEITDIAKAFDENNEFKEAISYLEQVNLKLSSNSLDPADVDVTCILSEQKLARLLGHLGFLANYTLASVKAIDVLNYRHFKSPKYKHHMVKLEQRFVGLAENQEIVDELLACNSVIIMHHGEENQYLNLSPFIIDENAFDDKASIAKLYFFDRYDKASNGFAFRHVYKPGDTPLIVEQQKNFQILKAQFEAFCKSVLNQSLQAL